MKKKEEKVPKELERLIASQELINKIIEMIRESGLTHLEVLGVVEMVKTVIVEDSQKLRQEIEAQANMSTEYIG